ncbi:MAG: hypothetical protein V3R64_05445 [Sphingomonadales bacterium]
MKSFSLVLLGLLIFAGLPAKAQKPVYNIENVTGDLYLFSDGQVNGVMLVTKEGIVVVDPGPVELAEWLKKEITSRFGMPVKYVVYANDQPEHFTGGPVFKDSADYLVHPEATATHENLRLTGKIAEAPILAKDYEIGGKEFRLLTALPIPAMGVLFPEEKVFYISDLIQVRSIPEKIFTDQTIKNHMVALFRFHVKFKTFLSGHGSPGSHRDYEAYQEFISTLLKQVFDFQRNGNGLEEVSQMVNLDPFQDWDLFSERRDQIISHVFHAIEKDKNFEKYLKQGMVFPIALMGMRIPEKLYNKKTCGWTKVQYDVTAKGNAKNIKVIDQQPPGVYGLISIESSRRHRYLPGFPGEGIEVITYYDFDGECEMVPKSPEEKKE